MTQRIPFADLAQLHVRVQESLQAAFDRVVLASSFTLGEEVSRFEQEFAEYCGARHCVGVNSGTAALTLMLLAAGVNGGDEVIVPAHTYIATALGVIHAGAIPVFCDVEPQTGLMDPRAAASAVTPRTVALLPVHLYGQVCDMAALGRLAQRHGLALFEDAAQAHGATHAGRRAGALGTAAAFSFYPSKNLGALGDGGAVTTDDDQLASQLRQLRNIGQRAKGEHLVVGFNERLDGLQAAFLRVKLPHLDGWNAARRDRAHAYQTALGGDVGCLAEAPQTPCVYHLFPIRVPARDGLASELGSKGVETAVHYTPAAYLQPPLQALGCPAPGAYPVADGWAAEELSLPMHPYLTDSEVEWVASIVRVAARSVMAGRA